MATCGCSKEVFRQSYELLYQDVSARYKDQGWTDREIRKEAARQFRPRYRLDVESYIRENTEKGAYYTTEFTIDSSGRIFFPSYNISLEALHENQRRKTPERYSLSDHQTSRMIEEAFRRGATTVVTSYAREGADNRDIVVMTYDPETKRGKQLIINAAPDGAFHTFDGIQDVAACRFSHLNKVSPSDRVFILTDGAMSLPQAQAVIQQVSQEAKTYQQLHIAQSESLNDDTWRDNHRVFNQSKQADQNPEESFPSRQGEGKDQQERKHIPLSRNEIPSEGNEIVDMSLVIAGNQGRQNGTDENGNDQEKAEVNRPYESGRYLDSPNKDEAIQPIAIGQKDRHIIETSIGTVDQGGIGRKDSSVSEVSIGTVDQENGGLLNQTQQRTLQGEIFALINDQQNDNYGKSNDSQKNALEKGKIGDLLLEANLGSDRFVYAFENEMLPNSDNKREGGEGESNLRESAFIFQESEGELQEQAIIIVNESDLKKGGAIESERNQEILPSAIEEEAMVLWFVYQAFIHGIGDRVLLDDQQQFVLSQESSFADDLVLDEQDVDMVGDQRDLLIEEFFSWIQEQPLVLDELLYDYEGFQDDEYKKAEDRINIPVVTLFLVALQRIANRSIDLSLFDSTTHDLDFSKEVSDERGQNETVDIVTYQDVWTENRQVSFFNQEEEHFILRWNVNKEEDRILEVFLSFYALRMFLDANRTFLYTSEQLEEDQYSLWILLSIIRYMTMMKENMTIPYRGLHTNSSKKTHDFPQSGIIFMVSLPYDGSATNQSIPR